MKSLVLLSILVLSSVLSFAQVQNNLIIFTEQGEKFYLILNGIRQNDNPETNVKVTGLNAPMYKAKFIFEDKTLGELDKNIFMPDVPSEVSYSLKMGKKGEYVVRVVSQVPLAQAAPPAPNQVVIVENTTPKPAISSSVTVTETTVTTNAPTGEQVNVNMGLGGFGVNMDVRINDGFTGTYSETTTTTTTTSTTTTAAPATPPAYVLPGYSGPIGCPMPMSDEQFSGVRQSIQSKTFEDSKLQIARQVIGNNCLLTRQVRDIMMMFTFEDSRLDIAKFSYKRTFDIGNYYMLNDAFTFESSIDELNRFIGGY